MNFTDETIKAELAVCEAATDGPWEVIDGHIPQIEAVNKKRGVRPAGCPYPRIARMAAGYAPDERNAELVVHACNNYEAALKELQRLRETVDKHLPDMLDELNKAGKEIDVLKRKLAVAEEALGELQRLRQLLATVLPEHFVCPDCGPFVAADDDGCCIHCGADCEPGDTRKDLEAE